MNIKALHTMPISKVKSLIAQENSKWPVELREIPRDKWPPDHDVPERLRTWRSRGFLVQAFLDKGVIRLSINRTAIDGKGNWIEDITWEELQRLKAEAGYGDKMAVEIFPADKDVVNVANLRHLWILDEPLPFGWKRK